MARRSAGKKFSAAFIRYWLPALLYTAVIFVLSAQPRLHSPFQFVNGDKVAHAIEYAGLGFVLARAFSGMLAPAQAGIAPLLAICTGLVVGTSDELFQARVPGRASSPFDLMADALGLLLGQFAYRRIFRRK